jgi:gliding motility-associated-like protein
VSGCEQILTISVNLIFNSSLNIPTAFTPNNDGVNDVYKLFGEDLTFIKFQIFGRWGELIYEGNSLSDSWYGNFKSKALNSQLFLLRVSASGKDGRKFEMTEKIKLIR